MKRQPTSRDFKDGKGQFVCPPWRFSTATLLEMKKLRDEKGLNNREIGDLYGIGRERVR